ncbi:hypothetical protein BFS35_007450 [Macrococcoides goetzii]|uniref:Uncharacterized protein n=1 Tax=Macrococcoides goetzii TaxID=1891097 RepID=A0A395GC57_9STAP|nr:hypothetical protein [Macrococcus goetzii]RAI81398.1 hypothetical protein BFS35_007450 [Macrococcus goetzii]
MIIEGKEIHFGIDKPIPYFQVSDEHRIRFGYEKMNGSLIKQIITDTYSDDNFDMEFLLSVIEGDYIQTEKTNLGRYFKITNWKEVFHKGEEDVDYINVIVKNIDLQPLIKYITNVVCGNEREAFILFYSLNKIIYVCNDVIDIVSHDTKFIEDFKSKYEGIYDTYWVGRPNDE